MTDKRKCKRFSPEEKEEIVTAARAGTSYLELATRLGCSPAAVSQVALKAGIRRRHMRVQDMPEPQMPEAEDGMADDAA